MSKSRIILIFVLILLLVGNFFWGVKYLSANKELRQTRVALTEQKLNGQILEFIKFFIIKVLKAETEVNFETRLKLENMVRDLADESILVQWSKFVDSRTEVEAQNEVKNLLEMLVNKLEVN